MSRTIKFRAWDKERKEMFNPSHLDRINHQDFFTTQRYTGDDTENFILMQFTGLIDKNGKEIYEGDIISNYQANVNCVFWFVDGSWCIENYHAGALLLSEYAIESEVIGNIYENTELLNSNQ